MNNREKFLRNNIGFHFEDLSLMRQIELETIKENMGVPKEWIYLALSKDKLENWEQWGFNLFRKPEFKQNIDSLLAALDKMDDDKFKNELRKGKRTCGLWIPEDKAKKVWESVLAQGRLYTPREAEKIGLKEYWTYGLALKEEGKHWIDNAIFEKQTNFDEDEWCRVVLSVQFVRLIMKGE